VLGASPRNDDAYLVEVKFHTANGKIILSRSRACRSARGIDGAVATSRTTPSSTSARGTVVGEENERYRINIGKSWRIGRGTEFTLTTPTFARVARSRVTARPAGWR